MITTNIKRLKKVSYFCLTLLSTALFSEAQGADVALEEEKQYNLVGVALFSGNDFVSNGIKWVTDSHTSHVGIILSDQKDEDKWYCFESTGSATEVLNGYYPHVRLTDWDETVKGYSGDVSYRLFVHHDQERTDAHKVTNFVEEYNEKSYTRNPFKLLKALFKANKPSKSNIPRTVFCSELTAKMFMDFGILQGGIASNYLPKHFSSQEKITLKSGMELTPEFKEKYSPNS